MMSKFTEGPSGQHALRDKGSGIHQSILAVLVAASIAGFSAGCDDPRSRGPSQAEIEAQRQTELARQRAEQEEQRRIEAEKAAKSSSRFATIVTAIVAFGLGLLVGTALGARTRADFAQQKSGEESSNESAPPATGGTANG